MINIKQNRTSRKIVDNKSKPFTLNKSTVARYNYKNVDNNFELFKQKKKCACATCRKYLLDPKTGKYQYCKTSDYRNPIIGHRKQQCPSANKKIKDTIYQDNYSKSCFKKDEESNLCYQRQIKSILNKNGIQNESYNYSTNQYLTRRCTTIKQQEFNFLSNTPVANMKNTYPSCPNCSYNSSGCSCNSNGFCVKINNTPCEIKNSKCYAVYKRSNKKFNNQGAVSGGSRINRLKYQTKIKAQTKRGKNGSSFLVNGMMPGSLYNPGKPLTMNDNTCPIYSSKACS